MASSHPTNSPSTRQQSNGQEEGFRPCPGASLPLGEPRSSSSQACLPPEHRAIAAGSNRRRSTFTSISTVGSSREPESSSSGDATFRPNGSVEPLLQESSGAVRWLSTGVFLLCGYGLSEPSKMKPFTSGGSMPISAPLGRNRAEDSVEDFDRQVARIQAWAMIAEVFESHLC